MRKKGPIWGEKYQRLIVESYVNGMFISDILRLPEIARFEPSEYTIRNILKANNVRANWKKKKRKPDLWEQDVVERIIELRNKGESIRSIRDALNSGRSGNKISKSTIVRILEANAGRVRFRPSRHRDIWKPSIVRRIVQMYESGMLISEIKQSELLREYKPSNYVIRNVLKSQGVQLTWKKGELRRWPLKAQKKIVEMYRSGMKFSEIMSDPDLALYRPTNYAIRKILKRHGVRTKGETRYKQPISDDRFRRYRNGRLSSKEEAIIHKHLETNETGRQLMIERMRLHLAQDIPARGRGSDRVRNLQRNAQRWADFFSWAICNLSSEEVKRNIIILGLEFGKEINKLATAYSRGDGAERKKVWSRVEAVSARMSDLFSEVLRKPARMFDIKAKL